MFSPFFGARQIFFSISQLWLLISVFNKFDSNLALLKKPNFRYKSSMLSLEKKNLIKHINKYLKKENISFGG